jgi:hypothetical protein
VIEGIECIRLYLQRNRLREVELAPQCQINLVKRKASQTIPRQIALL